MRYYVVIYDVYAIDGSSSCWFFQDYYSGYSEELYSFRGKISSVDG